MPRDHSRFTERFRALVAHETRQQTGKRIGVSAPYVSALAVGRHGPSRRVLQAIVAAYGLSLEEWLLLAGMAIHDAGLRAPDAGATVASVGNHYPRGFFKAVIDVLSAVYGDDLRLLPGDLAEPEETKAEVKARLVAIAERAQARRDRRRGHKAGSKRPPGGKAGSGIVAVH